MADIGFDEEIELKEEQRRKDELAVMAQQQRQKKIVSAKIKRRTELERRYQLPSQPVGENFALTQERRDNVDAEADTDTEEAETETSGKPGQPNEPEEELEDTEEETEQPQDEKKPEGEDDEKPEEQAQSEEEKSIPMPPVIGMDPATAEETLVSVGLLSKQWPQPTPGMEEPIVVGSSPQPGESVSVGQGVTLIVAMPMGTKADKEANKNGEPDKEPEAGAEPEAEAAGDAAEAATAGDAAAGAAGTAAEAGAIEGVAVEAGGVVVAGTSEFWIPALLIAGVVIVFFVVVIGLLLTMTVQCQQANSFGAKAKAAILNATGIGAFFAIPEDVQLTVCTYLSLNTGEPVAQTVQNTQNPGPAAPFGNDAAARALLASAGITVNKADCTGPGETPGSAQASIGCTSLDNTFTATVQEIINVTAACDKSLGGTGTTNKCGVQVTGGSEAGHAPGTCSHSSGNKMDVSAAQNLTSFIQSNFTPEGTRPNPDGGPQFGDPSITSSFVLESAPAHWDISVGCIG